MGSITSRGREWPPRPYKRRIVRNYYEVDDNNTHKGAVETQEDYVWVYPGAEIRNGGGGAPELSWDDAQSPGQESAIRHLEGD